MSAQAIFCGLLALVFLWFTWACIRSGEDDGRYTACCLAVTLTFAYFSYQGTTAEHLAEVEADRRASAERERKERTPHVIREAGDLPKPEDPEEMADAYFNEMGDHGEFFNIQQVPLQGAS